MSRTFSRLLVIAIACVVALALAGGVAMARMGGDPMARMGFTSWPVALQSGPSAASQSQSTLPATPAAAPAQDPDGDGDAADNAQGNDPANDQANDPAQEPEISGVVASVDAANSAFTLATGTGPVIVTVNSATQFDDGLSGLSSMQQGAHVTVEGTASVGQALATEVKGANDTNAPDSANNASPDTGQ